MQQNKNRQYRVSHDYALIHGGVTEKAGHHITSQYFRSSELSNFRFRTSQKMVGHKLPALAHNDIHTILTASCKQNRFMYAQWSRPFLPSA